MSDFPSNVSTTSTEGTTSTMENAKNAVYDNASAAANAVGNHPLTQSVVNGPLADNVRDQSAKTQVEFSNLANSRTTPATPAANGQQLTHYHSFFSSLLSWDNPRASGIAYLSTVAFILASRYLDILRYSFKVTYMALFVTVLAEGLGKVLFSHGLASQFRPKRYYTISKTTLDNLLGDVHELINFFVIESQRILFAENMFASLAAFFGSFLSYYLIKLMPFWGLSLIATSVLFVCPLVYKTNKEFIDYHIAHASSVVNQQTEQVKQLASQHAAQVAETTKQYAGEYAHKAQEMIGNARSRSGSPEASRVTSPTLKTNGIKEEDFPLAPREEFKVALAPEEEPLIAA
ncbi:putative Reticulon-like protein 1 [Sclerotinia borealis F-4128]|uniref:Reticulon-like protein n=1 Tax=Sclerotinia borealis (strain F-4128) TaxID=1432307 RepID=W9CWQ4_SCLBF|nr:putative Reticulon-like protein 1 [Sclerotinia borealis F-4128]